MSSYRVGFIVYIVVRREYGWCAKQKSEKLTLTEVSFPNTVTSYINRTFDGILLGTLIMFIGFLSCIVRLMLRYFSGFSSRLASSIDILSFSWGFGGGRLASNRSIETQPDHGDNQLDIDTLSLLVERPESLIAVRGFS